MHVCVLACAFCLRVFCVSIAGFMLLEPCCMIHDEIVMLVRSLTARALAEAIGKGCQKINTIVIR